MIPLLLILAQSWDGRADQPTAQLDDGAPERVVPLPAEPSPLITEDQAAAQVMACYDAALVQDPSLQGELTLVYTTQDGHVTEARVSHNTTSAQVAGCVLARAETWAFGTPGKRRVERTYLLQPVTAAALPDDAQLVQSTVEPGAQPTLSQPQGQPTLGIHGSGAGPRIVAANQHRFVGCLYQYEGEGELDLVLSVEDGAVTAARIQRNTTGNVELAACLHGAALSMPVEPGPPRQVEVTLAVTR